MQDNIDMMRTLNQDSDEQEELIEESGHDGRERKDTMKARLSIAKKISAVDYIFFILAGMNIGSVPFVMQAQIVNYDNLYKDLNFDFYIATPQYFALVCALILSKIIQSYTLQWKLMFFIIATAVTFSVVPFIAWIFPGSIFGMSLTLGIYFLSLSGSYMVQFYLLAICSQYPAKMTVFLLIFEPVFKVTTMLFKFASITFDFSIATDFVSMFSYFAFLQMGLIFILYQIKSSGRLDVMELNKDVREKGVDVSYLKTAFVIKWELIFLMVHLFVTFLTVPGVTFALIPVTIMSKKMYASILNILVPFFGIVGRIFANNPFNYVLTKALLFTAVLGDIFLIYSYYTNLNLRFEGIIFIVFVLHGFTFLRTACALTFFTIIAGRKATKKTKEAIGVLVTVSELIGQGGASLGALVFPFTAK